MSYGREKAVKFGANSSLIGIVTEPAPGADTAGKPAFILLNSGMLHRIGSCRLSVRVARELSSRGFTSLRFDYSGIGDSGQRRDAMNFERSSVLETQEAMDYLLRTKGASTFVLMGLCSGADMAQETAVIDQRVVGLMMIDAWVYRTPAYFWRHYSPKFFKWHVWKNSIGIRWKMLTGTYRGWKKTEVPVVGVEVLTSDYVRVFPPRRRVEADLRKLADRRVALFGLWTGGMMQYNHLGQYAAAFRRVRLGPLLREEFLPDADHILTGLDHQEYLIRAVSEWAREL